MKTTSLKSALFASLLVAGLSLTSCKDKADTKDPDTTDTVSKPMVDPTLDTTTTDTTATSTDTVTNPVGP